MPYFDKDGLVGLIKDKGKNQTGAGKAMDISQSSFSTRLNTGFFSDVETQKLAKFLGVPLSELLELRKPEPLSPGDAQFNLVIHFTGDQRQLIEVKESLHKLLSVAEQTPEKVGEVGGSVRDLNHTGRTGPFVGIKEGKQSGSLKGKGK